MLFLQTCEVCKLGRDKFVDRGLLMWPIWGWDIVLGLRTLFPTTPRAQRHTPFRRETVAVLLLVEEDVAVYFACAHRVCVCNRRPALEKAGLNPAAAVSILQKDGTPPKSRKWRSTFNFLCIKWKLDDTFFFILGFENSVKCYWSRVTNAWDVSGCMTVFHFYQGKDIKTLSTEITEH